MRTFEFTDAKSNKFWHIELRGSSFTVNFGRIGTKGQTQTKDFTDDATAKKEHDKLVAEKLKKGYVETTGAPDPVKSSDQIALESALIEHYDEVAAHSAYADYLMEQSDPRGEFIQVQLALEDSARSKEERDDLRKRETALLHKHTREWLGDAGRFLVGDWSGEDKPYCHQFQRGWLDFVRVLPILEAVIAAIARSPESRLLRRLEVVYDMRYHPFQFDQFVEGPDNALPEEERLDTDSFYMVDPNSILSPLIASPYLTNLRVLKYGFSDDHSGGPSYSTMVNPFESDSGQMLELLERCPRLEELYLNTDFHPIGDIFSSKLLGNLRVLQYYYGSGYSHYQDPQHPYPLSALAENKSLKNLTTLRLHPGRDAGIALDEFDALLQSENLPALAHLQVHMTSFGEEGAERIVQSGILKRLKTLDIGYGRLSDEGARILAACVDLKKLELLDVSQNALSQAGISALRATGIRLVADNQHEDDDDYHYSVDWE